MKNFDTWLSEKTSEDIKWLIKVYGTINNAYEKYIHEYLTECKDGC